MAAEQVEGGGGGMPDLSALGLGDMGSMQNMIEEAMNDPALMAEMEKMQDGMADVMAEMAKMSPEELQAQMMEGLQQLTGDDIMASIMENKDDVLDSLAQQGLIPPEKIAEYKADPDKFEQEMAGAFEQMTEVFNDPEMLKQATEMMQMMGNPDEMMAKFQESMGDLLGDDDKIEEARLQLLADPNSAGNPMLASMFGDEDMMEILQDPIKWRNAVKEGQGMLNGGGAARVGEL